MYDFKNATVKMTIYEDIVGYYLYIFNDPEAKLSDYDYIFDTFDQAKSYAKKKYKAPKNEWIKTEENEI